MKIRSSGLLVLALMASTMLLAQAPKAAAKSGKPVPKTADELREDCKKFVEDFFEWYLPKTPANASKQGTAEALAVKKRPEDFSRALVQALNSNSVMQNGTMQLQGIDGDPFLNCQNCPLHVKYGEPKLTGYKCHVPLYFMQGNEVEDQAHVIAEAMFTQKKWMFMNFLDGDGSGDLMSTLKKLQQDRANGMQQAPATPQAAPATPQTPPVSASPSPSTQPTPPPQTQQAAPQAQQPPATQPSETPK